MSKDDEQEKEGNSKPGKNALEWTVFAFSLVLVLSVLGFLGWQASKQKQTAPRLEIAVSSPQKAGENWLFPIEVQNRGTTTALSVEVEVEWKKTGETATFSFSELPREGRRRGFVVFAVKNGQIPEKDDLEAKILGYEEG